MIKNYLKTRSVIAVMMIMTASVNAEKQVAKKQKDDGQKAVPISQEERKYSYVLLGHLLSTAQKYLTDEENAQIGKLIGEGWKRMSMNQKETSKQ